MTLLKDTIEAFPLGITTEELLVLLDVNFDHDRRLAVLTELRELTHQQKIRQGHDGRWRPLRQPISFGDSSSAPPIFDNSKTLIAASSSFSHHRIESDSNEVSNTQHEFKPTALLKYWRSALQADPRGAVMQIPDRHGIDWHLITGTGPITMEAEKELKITISLDVMCPNFREALVRREAEDQSMAVGWPICVSRISENPEDTTILPAGLLSTQWKRENGKLILLIEADDILVNQQWIRSVSKTTSWSQKDLEKVFSIDAGGELNSNDFLERLQESMASQVRGSITGTFLKSEISPLEQGLFDIAALFLPSGSNMTAGAVRDLDVISTWSSEKIAETSLAPLIGISYKGETPTIPAINTGPLNSVQLKALQNACTAPISVIAGPPGTGKSQVIVSIAASVLASGGSVLVASKIHQALNAVEDRLGNLAEGVPFIVRTLDPQTDRDTNFTKVLSDIISDHVEHAIAKTNQQWKAINSLAEKRSEVLKTINKRAILECKIAELLEKDTAKPIKLTEQSPNPPKSIFMRILKFFGIAPNSELPKLKILLASEISKIRNERDQLKLIDNPVELTDIIANKVQSSLPILLSKRVSINESERQKLIKTKNKIDLVDGKSLILSIANKVVSFRPLWLASVLGTPNRIPLKEGLFDLVIFDEAGQCDIASSIPLFARARRAVVVGDDQQLSFIPSLGIKQDRNLMAAHGLPIDEMVSLAQSRRTLFDASIQINNVPRVMLTYQYRSAAPIVNYISKEYYRNKLQTAYDPNNLKTPEGMEPGLHWTHVPSPIESMEFNINLAEVEAISKRVEELLIEQHYSGSIGVITPFRPQVAKLDSEIRKRIIQRVLNKSELLVSTVDSFQGLERDVILFSPCLGKTSSDSARTFVQRELRRLNVAISRARAVAHIFGDLDFAKSGKVASLARLAEYATEPYEETSENVFDSKWERYVFNALKEHGLEPIPQFEIAGRRLDFALFGQSGTKLNLEVDGRQYHQDIDGQRKITDHWRDHQFKSLGWKVRRFWVDELAKNMENCIDIIKQDLK